MEHVLFICVDNSGLSQMAEAFLKQYGAGKFMAESAGFAPTALDPDVIEVMNEVGLDITHEKVESVFELFRVGRRFSYVITVCDEAHNANCPIFPGITHRLHLPFPDPADMTGPHEERLKMLRELRNRVRDMVTSFIGGLEHGDLRKLTDNWDMACKA